MPRSGWTGGPSGGGGALHVPKAFQLVEIPGAGLHHVDHHVGQIHEHPLARWFGVSDTNLPVAFPNIGRFAKPNLGFLG